MIGCQERAADLSSTRITLGLKGDATAGAAPDRIPNSASRRCFSIIETSPVYSRSALAIGGVEKYQVSPPKRLLNSTMMHTLEASSEKAKNPYNSSFGASRMRLVSASFMFVDLQHLLKSLKSSFDNGSSPNIHSELMFRKFVTCRSPETN